MSNNEQAAESTYWQRIRERVSALPPAPPGSYGAQIDAVRAELLRRGASVEVPGVLPRGWTALDLLERRLANLKEEEAELRRLRPGGLWEPAPLRGEALDWPEEAIARARRLAAVVEAPRVQPARNDHPWRRKVWSR